ncbi:MAG: metallophosphoesterase [Clostridia bacterium]|nr:metallophosphoesterase [Clostridia bacterium]
MDNRDIVRSHFSRAAVFREKARGAVILHISDTATWQYASLSELLSIVRPDLIIHTGDCADEYKVGRKEGDREPYEAAIKKLIKILQEPDCPIIFTYGNNDDILLLEGEKNVTIMQNHTEFERFGVKFMIDHYPYYDTVDVDFAMYGHSARFDPHYPPKDSAGEPVYLNGNFYWTVIDSHDKGFLRLPCIQPLVFDDKYLTDENGEEYIMRTEKGNDRSWRLPPKRRWFLTQMHLHAGVEDFSSMRSHAAAAKAVGYNALFITEHDLRMNRNRGCIESFWLESEGAAERPDLKAGWYKSDDTPADASKDGDGYSLLLNESESATFKSIGKKHQVSLLADVTVTVNMSVAGSALVDFTLSQRPEDFQQQHIRYGIGDVTGEEWFKSVQKSDDGVYTFKLSDDVLLFDPEFGQDNALLYITVTAVSGKVAVKRFDIDRKYVAEDVRKRQKTLGKTIGPKYNISINSGFEMSLGHHQNCFSAYVPVTDYGKTGFVKSKDTGAEYLKSKDATFAYNHMFSERKNVLPEEHEKTILEMVEFGLSGGFGGAGLLEVGFPEGRYTFSIEEHLKVWDMLAIGGLKMVGYGDSDSHNSKIGWLDGNNFGSWILSRDRAQETLERAMRKGRVCFGNPVRFKSNWDFKIGDSTIGDTVKCDGDVTAEIKFSKLAEPVLVRVVSGGEVIERYTVSTPSVEIKLDLSRGDLDCCPVRVEVWSNEVDSKPLFFTNPIYLEK